MARPIMFDDEKLEALIAKEERDIATRVLRGHCAPDEYHRLCGVLEGLAKARVIVKEAKRGDDDDAD